MQPNRTEVLIVGAGPVGLLTAVLLAEAGIRVEILDREQRTTTRSYACALHPATLDVMDHLGLTTSLLNQGKKIEKTAFYEKGERRAEISFAKAGGKFPYLLVLPQSAFESALENLLQEKYKVSVQWNHRFDDLEQRADSIEATVEELEGTTSGYIIPHWQLAVKRRYPIRCQYLIGADGANSLVRRRLGINLVSAGKPQAFAAYEFEPQNPVPDELRVAMDVSTTNVLWPLPEGKCRWTFQMPPPEKSDDFPQKERRAARVSQRIVDEEIKQYVEEVAHQRAPWFSSAVKEITWCTRVAFEPRHADEFGRGNSVLAGDAAHQTGPVGAQSMNAGFLEAVHLRDLLVAMIKKNESTSILQTYFQEQETLWQALLGFGGGLHAKTSTNPWVRANSNRILPCIAAIGSAINALASQIDLEFPIGANAVDGTK